MKCVQLSLPPISQRAERECGHYRGVDSFFVVKECKRDSENLIVSPTIFPAPIIAELACLI